MRSERIAGWGRQFQSATQLVPDALTHAPPVLFRGLGRSAGDSSLPPPSNPLVVNTTRANRITGFDSSTGRLRAEAGLSLRELNRLFLPRGWCVPVTPGTQFVTLGGMVACDVHGKNHHVDGCFGHHVERLKMRLADGRLLECGPDLERELFLATVGGMGLTGQILEVELTLRPIPTPWIWHESERVDDVEGAVDKLKAASKTWPMTVAWVDGLARGAHSGRGILMKGRWAEPHQAPAHPPSERPAVRFPVQAPEFVLSRLTVGALNFGLYWQHLARTRQGLVDPFSFLYPLDFLQDWNLLYGRRGLTQYQCVFPDSAGPGAPRRLLELLERRGASSFLCLLKDCGPQSPAYLSFPRPGTSLALDLPVGGDTQALIDALNEQVLSEGGRIYLAKDQFTRPEHFRAMEQGRLERFLEARHRWDPHLTFRSAQSVRLFGDRP